MDYMYHTDLSVTQQLEPNESHPAGKEFSCASSGSRSRIKPLRISLLANPESLYIRGIHAYLMIQLCLASHNDQNLLSVIADPLTDIQTMYNKQMEAAVLQISS